MSLLGEQLLHSIMRFKKIGMPLPPGFELHPGELVMLMEITSRTGRETRVNEITESLCVSRPAVSQALGNLERKGYVKREISQRDRRKVSVTLTPQGEQTLERAREYIDRTFEALVDEFGSEDTLLLTGLLGRMIDIFETQRRAREEASVRAAPTNEKEHRNILKKARS